MKNNIKQKTKKLTTLKPYIINTLIAILIFYLTLIINDIAPFGKYDLAQYEAFYQYKPMLFNFIRKIQDGTLLNYSFLNGLGNSFFFNFTHYLSSPINLLVLPFKSANSMFIAIITIKLIITSITTTFYSLKKTNNKTLSTIISLSYIFSAWFLAYHESIIWLDSFMMFPLLQYGIEKIINENKPYTYIFSLAYIMISNFYMAWIICLYTLSYFIFQMIFTKKELSKKIKIFNIIVLSTIATIGLSLFSIYITYDNFLNIQSIINSTTPDLTTIPMLNIIKAFFSGNIIVPLKNNGEIFPNIAINTIFTISLLYYFINNKIDKKERIKSFIIFILLIALLYSKQLNYIINGFRIPIGHNFKYSFLISFYLIHLFIKNCNTFDTKIDKKIFFINILLITLLIIEFIFKNIETNIFILNIVALIIYTLFFIFYKNKQIFKYIFTLIVILEIGAISIININSYNLTIDQNYTYHKNANYREILNHNIEYGYFENIALYENKNGIPYFSTMQYNQTLLDLQTLGCYTDTKEYVNICPNNQIFKTLLNIKTNNNYHLEKIFTTHKEIQNIALNNDNYFENQNLLLKTIANTNIDYLTKENIHQLKKQNNKYKITKTGSYYINLKNIYQVIIINNTAYTYNKDLVKNKDLEIIEIKNSLHLQLQLNKNDIIEIIYPSEQEPEKTLEVYLFNEQKFVETYNKLQKNQIKYTSYKDNLIEGTITVEQDQIIFTSIPYDKHWKITIDDKEVEPVLILNSLTGIECEPGTHKIKLEYKTNFTIPIIISLTTFIGLIIKIIYDRKQKKNDN